MGRPNPVHAGVVGDSRQGGPILPRPGENHDPAQQIWPPLGLERRVPEGLLDVRLIGSLHGVNQRAVTKRGFAEVSLDALIRCKPLRLHGELELNRVPGVPFARDHGIPFLNVRRLRLAVHHEAGNALYPRLLRIELAGRAVRDTDMHGKGSRLFRMN